MPTNDSHSVTIKIEKDDFTKQDFLAGNPMVRTGIQIYVNQTCLTSTSDAYRVSDYLPQNCNQWLRAIKTMISGDQGHISFSDTVCEIYLLPVSEDMVTIRVERSNGSKFNPNVPDDGVYVSQTAVIAEALNYSQTVHDRFEAIDETTGEYQSVSQLHELLADVEHMNSNN